MITVPEIHVYSGNHKWTFTAPNRAVSMIGDLSYAGRPVSWSSGDDMVEHMVTIEVANLSGTPCRNLVEFLSPEDIDTAPSW